MRLLSESAFTLEFQNSVKPQRPLIAAGRYLLETGRHGMPLNPAESCHALLLVTNRSTTKCRLIRGHW